MAMHISLLSDRILSLRRYLYDLFGRDAPRLLKAPEKAPELSVRGPTLKGARSVVYVSCRSPPNQRSTPLAIFLASRCDVLARSLFLSLSLSLSLPLSLSLSLSLVFFVLFFLSVSLSLSRSVCLYTYNMYTPHKTIWKIVGLSCFGLGGSYREEGPSSEQIRNLMSPPLSFMS